MALSPSANQFIDQQGFMRLVDVSAGPRGPRGATAHWLVPTNGYVGSQRFPHEVVEELKGENYETTTVEGLEYYLVPEESTNLPGVLAHYAQTTGVADLENPPGGGVNRVRETLESTAEATVAPETVEKYVEDNDSFEEARKKKTEHDERVDRQVTTSPAREPAEGKLVVPESKESKRVSKAKPSESKPGS